MARFYIDPKYLTSVTEHVVVYRQVSETTTLFDVIKDPVLHSTTATRDHPKFAKLRQTLADRGFINKVDSYWNGDRVRKTFYLNNVKFKPDDTFVCASAMAFHLNK